MPRLRFDSSQSPTWSATAASGAIAIEFPQPGHAIPLSRAGDLCREILGNLETRSRTRRYAGFFSYELGRCFEALPWPSEDRPQLPLAAFLECDGRTAPEQSAGATNAHERGEIESNFTKAEYLHAVRRCLDYVAAGDVFQINLAQQLRVATAMSADAIYARLRQDTPGLYDALLDFEHYALISNSPELFLRVTRLPDGRRRIVNRPIKGTRPAAPDMAAELTASAKDAAELAMIVDLQRNDLGRICQTGTVRVRVPREIETHSTVLHGVATIEGILRDDVTLFDILRATFPCGSVTGCPKIRAMQIIDELEPDRRDAYCGAIGWIENGEMELSVAIRTMTLANGIATIPVGGGIVADSDPQAEYAETLVKARALLSSLGASVSFPSGGS